MYGNGMKLYIEYFSPGFRHWIGIRLKGCLRCAAGRTFIPEFFLRDYITTRFASNHLLVIICQTRRDFNWNLDRLHVNVYCMLIPCIEERNMNRIFEATIEKRDKWYIGWVDEVPGTFSQGKTIKEVQENLEAAVQLILESQRELRVQGISGEIVKRQIKVQV
jgi:predicted RNase H-like HicB family nuclease